MLIEISPESCDGPRPDELDVVDLLDQRHLVAAGVS